MGKSRLEEHNELIKRLNEKEPGFISPIGYISLLLNDMGKSLAVIADTLMKDNSKEHKENTNHTSWDDLKNGSPIPPIEDSESDGSGIYKS